MSNLQKLIKCWRPIKEMPLEPLDGDTQFVSGVPFHLLRFEKGDIEYGFLYYDTQEGGKYTFPVANKDRGQPTHYMSLDTPEKLAKIVGVLVDALALVGEVSVVSGDASRKLEPHANYNLNSNMSWLVGGSSKTAHKLRAHAEIINNALQQVEKIAGE